MKVAVATTDRAEIETLTEFLGQRYQINDLDDQRRDDVFSRVFTLADKRLLQGNQIARLVYDLTSIDARRRVRKPNKAIAIAKHTAAYVLHHHCKWSTAQVAGFLGYSNHSSIVLALRGIPEMVFDDMAMNEIVDKVFETVKCHKQRPSNESSTKPQS
jgi:hypothetical protein